jgi:hypothetical protein
MQKSHQSPQTIYIEIPIRFKVFNMSENHHYTERVTIYIQDNIKKYLKINRNAMLNRSHDSELIRDMILKIDLLSNNLVYKQERDAFYGF